MTNSSNKMLSGREVELLREQLQYATDCNEHYKLNIQTLNAYNNELKELLRLQDTVIKGLTKIVESQGESKC